MAKLVITKNRDQVDTPTLFFTVDRAWHSVSNKQEFKAIADKVKIEYDAKEAEELIASIQDWTNVRVNIEMTPVEFFDFNGNFK